MNHKLYILSAVVLASLVLLPAAAHAQVDHLDVIWLGNSYSQYSYGSFQAFADADPTSSLTVMRRHVSNSNLTQHYDGRYDNFYGWGGTLADNLSGNAYDYVMLQDYSTRPLDSYSGGDVPAFKQSVRDLAAFVDAQKPVGSNPTIAMFETWSRATSWSSYTADYTQADAQAELRTNYGDMATETGGLFLPVGDAFEMARAQGFTLVGSDGSHANDFGNYLAGAVFYEAMFDKDVRNVNYDGVLTATDAAALREIAHTAVPEPATMSLLGLGGLALLRRRKR